MSYPTVDPETGFALNSIGTDVELLWFETGTEREWLSAVIKAALWQFKGQWIYDVAKGIDYLGEVFVSNPSVYTLANLYRTVIVEIPEVDQLLTLTVTFDSEETATVNWVVISKGAVISGSTPLTSSTGEGPYPFIFSSEFSSAFA